MSYNNDLIHELGQNFIEYAAAVNGDRAIPEGNDGLKPVAKRILFGSYDSGFGSNKEYVKCARIVGDVMGKWHPHGDSSIYGALVRLSQPWVMRYPLIDFYGNMGNMGGDGPAAYRYTNARLGKLAEEGMLVGLNKNVVDFIPNYDENDYEPTVLPSIFPNLLCNPNTGIGVAMRCNWAPHNLREVRAAIEDYMDGKEPMLPGPDFPTGGEIINKDVIPSIMKTGRGSVKVRGRYKLEGETIVFYEIPYGTNYEEIINQIGELADTELTNIKEIRNESNKKGLRICIECDGKVKYVLNQLFAKTDLQISFSYNQVALVNKTPTELNLVDCIKLYINHNINCIVREATFDIEKAQARNHIVQGLLKALEDIDNIIALIKQSASAADAKVQLMSKYGFSDEQAKAILDMKLAKLASLEKVELENEAAELLKTITELNRLINSPELQMSTIRERLNKIVAKYGDDRRTVLNQIAETKEEKEIVNVEPEKVVVIMSETGLIKRIPASSFKTQKRNGKGIKTQDDITAATIRTNTVDSLMVFTNYGNMYRILVDDIPVGTNTVKGTPISSLIEMQTGEKATLIYSIYRDTDAQYILFTTKQGMVKKSALSEYTSTRKKSGIAAIKLKENDELVSVNLVKDEDIIIVTKNGMSIRFNSTDIGASGRATIGVKGITLKPEDEVVNTVIVRDTNDNLGIFYNDGAGKKISLTDLIRQGRAGKGLMVAKDRIIVATTLINDSDMIFIAGSHNAVCISASEVPLMGRTAIGNQLIKNSDITSVTKV